MGIVFALRGNSLTARYAPGGGDAMLYGADVAEVNTDEAGINGTNSIDMSGISAVSRIVGYPSKHNVPATGNISVLMRVKFDSVTDNIGLFKLGFGGRIPKFGIMAYLTSSNQVRFYQYDEAGNSDAVFSTAPLLSTGVWYDLFFRYPITATVGGSKFAVDGTYDKEQNSVLEFANWADYVDNLNFVLGYYSDSADTTRFHLDEVVVWDELIDPTSVTLTTGSGSLNGASRTAYVDVAADTSSALGGASVNNMKIGI